MGQKQFIQAPILNIFVWLLLYLPCTESISCGTQPGTTWAYGYSMNGEGSCYLRSSNTMEFTAAKDLCENQLGMHVVFFETAAELDKVGERSNLDVWLGLTAVGGHFYWTYYQTMTGSLATFTDFQTSPAAGTQAVSSLNAQWRAVSPSEKHYAMCELNDNWDNILSGYSPLPTPVESTTPQPPSTTDIPGPCEVQRTSEDTSFYQKFYLVKLETGLAESMVVFSARSLLACVTYCLLDGACCHVAFTTPSKMCYRLILPEGNSTAVSLDCGEVNCYRVVY